MQCVMSPTSPQDRSGHAAVLESVTADGHHSRRVAEIVSGLRIGFSVTLLGVLIGEMFASQRGLGYLIMNAIGLHDVPTIMATILLLGIVAVSASALLLWLDHRLHRVA